MVNNNAVGVIFSNMHDNTLKELTVHRTLGSVPFGSRYRLVDFALSNMVNAGISKIGIVTKNNYRSLMDHLGSGRDWDLARKRGGLYLLPPYTGSNSGIYTGRLEAFSNILNFLYHTTADYVIVADCEVVSNLDLSSMLAYHESKGAEITLAYKKDKINPELHPDFVVLDFDKNQRVKQVLINPKTDKSESFWLDIMIINRELLIELAEDAKAKGLTSFKTSVLQKRFHELSIFGYEITEFSEKITDLKSFYKINMSLLNPQNRKNVFPPERPVYTKVKDAVPVKYGINSSAQNCLIADGCIIEGTVRNSVIFRDVTIEKGAVVEDCVLLQGTIVRSGCILRHVVTDKNVVFTENLHLCGATTYPMMFSKDSII